MQSLSTQIVQLDVGDKSALLEKGFSLQKRKVQANKTNRKKKKKGRSTQESIDDKNYGEQLNGNAKNEAPSSAVVDGSEGRMMMLKRKRFHNFTETVMAHEYLAYRRLDRMYHRATLRYPNIDPSKRPFLILSLTGDVFLNGQVLRMIGVFLALANGMVDSDFIDCVFDESYPHLIPTPPALPIGMMASEAYYMTWEGNIILYLTYVLYHNQK